jgi:P-type conjugative transfer protein TrbJ
LSRPVWAVTWATEWTQVLNNMQLAQQTVNEVKSLENELQMIRNQVESLKSIASYGGSWGDVDSLLNNVTSVMNRSQAVSNTIQERYQSTRERIARLSGTFDVQGVQGETALQAMATADDVMSTIDQQDRSITEQQQVIKQIIAKSDAAVGQTQAIQALNKLVEQLSYKIDLLYDITSKQVAMQSEQKAGESQANKTESDWVKKNTSVSWSAEPKIAIEGGL